MYPIIHIISVQNYKISASARQPPPFFPAEIF